MIKVSDGAVAQLGERRVRNAKVGSSILLGSTNKDTVKAIDGQHLLEQSSYFLLKRKTARR